MPALKRYNQTSGEWELVSGGDAEAGGDVETYVHTQASPATVWAINHGLSRYPSVTTLDADDDVILGDIEYVNSSTVNVTFGSAIAGKAYLN